MNALSKLSEEEEKKSRRRETKRRYCASEKGKAAAHAYYLQNKTKHRLQMKARYEALKDTEDHKRYYREYYQRNKERFAENSKRWRMENPEAARAMERRRYVKNYETRRKYAKSPKALSYHKEYYKKNKERIIKRTTANTASRIKNNPHYRIAALYRNRVRAGIKMKGAPKIYSSEDLVGCSWGELRAHLESLFRDGMSWENHSVRGWHIDHIIPCAAFDLTDPEQQKKCFHYTNLQPLWWHENLSKPRKLSLRFSA